MNESDFLKTVLFDQADRRENPCSGCEAYVLRTHYLALRRECEMLSAQNATLDEGLATYEARIDTLESAGKRVIAAFEALGKHNGQIDVLPRAECIAAMTAFKAAIDAGRDQ